MLPDPEYDVALSFAGEQRDYVDSVAASLRDRGVRVFYDLYEQANLWGKDLYEHLDYVYQRAARYCVVFASAEYAAKMWTNHERKSAQARAIEESVEYILPARFDATEIPGIRKTVGYIDLSVTSPDLLADLIVQKLGPRVRQRFFPPVPDRLFEALEIEESEEEAADRVARAFFRALTRMDEDERRLLFQVFLEGCTSELPDNVHVSLDLMRRASGLPVSEVIAKLSGLGALGVEVVPRLTGDHDADDMIEVRWEDFTTYSDDEVEEWAMAHSTAVAREMLLGASADYCADCAVQALGDLDFSALSSALVEDGHRPSS